MKKPDSRLVCGMISVLCPVIVAVIFIVVLWNEPDYNSDEYRNGTPAVVLRAIADGMLMIGSLIVFCSIGLIAGVISFRMQQRFFGVGLVGLIINGLPFLLYALFLIKGALMGW